MQSICDKDDDTSFEMLCHSATEKRGIDSLQPVTTYCHLDHIDTIADAEANAVLSVSELIESSSDAIAEQSPDVHYSCPIELDPVQRLRHNRPPTTFSEDMYNAVVARAQAESWEDSDVTAAFLQASLLSYQSADISAEERLESLWNRIYDQDGRRYVKSAPQDYRYNCPWNDWTPPSDSRRRFMAAQSEQKRKSSINLCVRVRVCLSPYSLERGEETMIAFASVESDALGAKSLVLRRGSHILARMPLSIICIHQEHGYDRVLRMSTMEPSQMSIYLHLENEQRFHTLCALL